MTSFRTVTSLRIIGPPRWPDELVFGPPLPDGAEGRIPAYTGPMRYCTVHPGVGYPPAGCCLMCETE